MRHHDALMVTIEMRTTLTVEDRLIADLKRAAQASGKPFKQVVNEALRAGLEAGAQPAPRPYRLKPTPMGQARAGIDLTRARQLSDALEDEAIAAKLAQRK